MRAGGRRFGFAGTGRAGKAKRINVTARTCRHSPVPLQRAAPEKRSGASRNSPAVAVEPSRRRSGGRGRVGWLRRAGWLPVPTRRRGAGPQPRGGPRVGLLLAVRAGLRGPSVPRPWTAWPRPDLLRRAGSRRSVQLVEACSSTNTRQIPTLIIPSTRILAVAPTYLISLTPSSENHVPLN